MCNLSKGVYERGIQVGEVRGIQIGEVRGIQNTMLAALRSLMETMNITGAQAMEFLKVPQADREKYAALLAQ